MSAESWSSAQVSRMSGVTSRTLRHYDAIRLLKPATVSSNGYRCYGEAELLRLQQILLLRDLGMGLSDIAGVVDGECDQVAALRRHLARVAAERERLHRLAETVWLTIAHLEGHSDMTAEQWFDSFSEKQATLETELVGRFGDDVTSHFASARQHTQGWTQSDYEGAAATYDRLDARMLAQLVTGARPEDQQVFAVLDDHLAAVSQFWAPNRTSYAGLGRLYVDSPEFRTRYDALDTRLAEFYREEMAAYAEARMS